jgi:ATP-dependent DNA helicase RecQ
MGIDKPNVRFVVHVDLPDDLESYFQEAGRAGRDGKKSWAIILYQQSDITNLERRVTLKYPEIKEIKNVYQALGNYFQIPVGTGKDMVMDFKAGEFVSKYHFNILVAYHSLKFLEKEGYLALSEDVHIPSKLHFIVGRDDLYKFQVKNEKLDGFIKLVLRSYSGLFSDYVNIDEQTLANRSGLSKENIYTYLKSLSKAGIVKYIPRRKNPVITYTEERLDEKNLRISKENYLNRKNRYMGRLEAVKEYVTNDKACRSMLLLRYFGEKNMKRCGICDFCVRRNELELSNYELEEISELVKKNLGKKPYLIDELVEITEGFPDEKILKVIQWQLDNNILTYNEKRQLLLNSEEK